MTGLDAKTLSRLARIDPGLLCPVRHHSAAGQAQLSVIRARAVLVSARTALVNAARGLAKPHGERLRRSGTQRFGRAMAIDVSAELRTALEPLLTAVEGLTEQIQVYDRHIEEIAKQQHPEVRALKQVDGVGTLIALSYVLTIEDPHRFRRSRDVGCFFGLRPGRRNSGNSQPQLHISKEGDSYLRTLMVQGVHHILGPLGQDCDLRRWGLKLAGRGGKKAKKRAIVAVARKLAVLLHRLWPSGAVYEPLSHSQPQAANKAA
jgi:transposase